MVAEAHRRIIDHHRVVHRLTEHKLMHRITITYDWHMPVHRIRNPIILCNNNSTFRRHTFLKRMPVHQLCRHKRMFQQRQMQMRTAKSDGKLIQRQNQSVGMLEAAKADKWDMQHIQIVLCPNIPYRIRTQDSNNPMLHQLQSFRSLHLHQPHHTYHIIMLWHHRRIWINHSNHLIQVRSTFNTQQTTHTVVVLSVCTVSLSHFIDLFCRSAYCVQRNLWILRHGQWVVDN